MVRTAKLVLRKAAPAKELPTALTVQMVLVNVVIVIKHVHHLVVLVNTRKHVGNGMIVNGEQNVGML